MNVVREIQRINDRELQLGISFTGRGSWHDQYRKSAYIFIGGIESTLSEGDLICIFSQFGEVVDCNLVRDQETGHSRGFGFLAYENVQSTVLAIDNMNGAHVLGRCMRVDHADKYRRPKQESMSSSVITSGDQQFQIFDDTPDEAYDTRRKLIWDYEKYAAQPAPASAPAMALGATKSVATNDVSSASLASLDASSLSSLDANAQRILQLNEARRKQRQLEREAEEQAQADAIHARSVKARTDVQNIIA